MFRLDDRTDEGSQGIEERLRRGGLIRDEGRRTDRPPDPVQERPCRQALREKIILWSVTATMQPREGIVHLACPLPSPRSTQGGKVLHSYIETKTSIAA